MLQTVVAKKSSNFNSGNMQYEFYLKNYSKITTLANRDVSENISSLKIKNVEEVKQSN